MPGPRNRRLGTAAAAAVLAALAPGCGDDGPPEAQTSGRGRVAAVIKGLENPFFATMRLGLVAGAKAQALRLRVDSSSGLQDTEGQASALESLATQPTGCVIVNPINSLNLLGPLSHLAPRTPIVNLDSPVDRRAAEAAGVRITTYIGTDNHAAGRLGAEAMARLVAPGARVAVITGIPGDAGSAARTAGFRAAARGRFRVVRAVAADFDRDRARMAAADQLGADPRLRGFFAVNDEMALGVADAVRARGRARSVSVVGMDGTREALEAIRRGRLSATVAQYPYAIGQLGIEACAAAARGAPLPPRVDAPVAVVTRDNVARALARFPQPLAPFRDPLRPLSR